MAEPSNKLFAHMLSERAHSLGPPKMWVAALNDFDGTWSVLYVPSPTSESEPIVMGLDRWKLIATGLDRAVAEYIVAIDPLTLMALSEEIKSLEEICTLYLETGNDLDEKVKTPTYPLILAIGYICFFIAGVVLGFSI